MDGSGQGQVAGSHKCHVEHPCSINWRGITWLPENLLASQEGLCFIELVGWLVGWSVSWYMVVKAFLVHCKRKNVDW